MPVNKLYRFLVKNPNGFQFKSTELHQFALYELDEIKLTLKTKEGTEYQIGKHHVSVYENQSKNVFLSQYHYTAYFYDVEGAFYQLHVYFNENDQLTTEPVFSIKDKDGNFIKQNISEELIDLFIQTALDNTLNLIGTLKQGRQTTCTQLENNYANIEKELCQLSSDLDLNKAKYLEKIDQAIIVLKDLAELHENENYSAILNLFESRKKSLSTDSQVKYANLHSTSKEESKAVKSQKQEKLTVVKTEFKIKVDSLSSLNDKARKAYGIFAIVPKDSYRQKVNCFLSFDKFVSDILVSTSDANNASKDLHESMSLVSKRNVLARELAGELISKREFKLAEGLKRFINPVPEKFVKLAFENNDAELLDFLLTNSHFSINTFLIDKVSPVLYCYLNHSKDACKSGCLSVLIKHNASLMVKTPDGRSVAYSITQDDHPLRTVLIENFDKTLGKVGFLYQLLLEIRNLIAKEDDQVTKSKLLEIEKKLKSDMEALQKSKSRSEKLLLKKCEELTLPFLDNEAQKIAVIKDHPEAKKKILEFKNMLNEFIKISSKKVKKSILKNLEEAKKKMEQLADEKYESQDITLKEFLEMLDDFKMIIQLKQEAFELEGNIKSHKSRKEKNQIVKRKNEIAKALKKLGEEYGFLSDYEQEKEDETFAFGKRLDEIEETLKGIKEILFQTQLVVPKQLTNDTKNNTAINNTQSTSNSELNSENYADFISMSLGLFTPKDKKEPDSCDTPRLERK